VRHEGERRGRARLDDAELVGRTLDYPWALTREDGSPLPRSERGAVAAVQSGQSQATARSSSVVLRDAAQVAYAVVTTFVDVTELWEAKQQVKLIANRLNDALAGGNMGTWELDLETRAATRNARWAEILGHTPDEIGRRWRLLRSGFTQTILQAPPRPSCFAIRSVRRRSVAIYPQRAQRDLCICDALPRRWAP
jgi:PAS domain-containing protein